MSDSDDDNTQDEDPERVSPRLQTPQLKKYFLILQHGLNMALKVDNSSIPNGELDEESCRLLLESVSMSDLAIPDHVGWLLDQPEHCKVWGVVIDMLFCVFKNQGTLKPEEVIILPGCNIRPLVYNTAVNGIHTNKHSQTISGLSKFQFVIDDSSTGRKHVYGVESQHDLDTWYRVLKRASALDPESTNDITSSNENEVFLRPNRRLSFDGELPKVGYIPSQDSRRRSQKMKSPRDPDSNANGETQLDSPRSMTPHSQSDGNQPSPRSGQAVNDQRRPSVQEFKKRLRQETKPEATKAQPVKATHFAPQPSEEGPQTSVQGKKMRSFGSFESLLKFKRKKRSTSEDSTSNEDGGSIVSSGSIVSGSSNDHELVKRSVDISAQSSVLGKKKTKKLSKSLELDAGRNGVNSGIVRRASDIKDRVFNRRSGKPCMKLGDLQNTSLSGFLLNKHHLKWQKLWCVVCRGCFYGFKTNSPDENAQLAVMLANCAVVFVSEQDKRQKHLYIFKLSQEKSKSIYLCTTEYNELMKWLTVLQMESNSVISNIDKLRRGSECESDSICSSLSSQSGSLLTNSSNEQTQGTEPSRSRSKKKKKAPVKPPRQFRNSSCPPSVARNSGSSTGDDTLTSGSVSSSTENNVYGSTEELPRYDKTVSHVWQNDRGYLFNAIRAKLSAYRKKETEGQKGAQNDKVMVVQDGDHVQGSREVRRSRSFNARPSSRMTETDPKSPETQTESPSSGMRKRHKPLVVKKIAAADLAEKQTIAGYIERKSLSAQWIRYWYVLHEGSLFCYLTSDDNVTVDVLNLHGYTVSSLVDKFRGKRFVLQLSHDNFTSLYLSVETREEMESWQECLQQAIKQPSSSVRENGDVGACAGCDSNRQEDDMKEKRKQVKQRLLEEMLRQKHELEKKQAERLKKQRKGLDSPDSSPNSPYPPEFTSEGQRTSDVTRLRQRRLSTQLKVDTIQRQLDKPSGTKRGLFGFGKAKKLDENKNVFLQDQLKELTDKLHKIDTDLIQVESEKRSETYDFNQNRKTVAINSAPPNTEGENEIHEEDVKRNVGLKNAVQKWTSKTFSKVSVKKKNLHNSSLPLNSSMPNLGHEDANGSGDLDNGFLSDSDQQDFSLLENSVTDLTRPLADLKLELNSSYTQQNGCSGSTSPVSVRYNRSNSKSSTLSSLSSPRREIDPSVLAEIDAFEELTRQVLGARSKETPTK